MASQLELFKKCQMVKTPGKRKHWEFEISFGRHCGKFISEIPEPFWNVLRNYLELTDSQAVEYRDYYQGDIRTRRQLKHHGHGNTSGGGGGGGGLGGSSAKMDDPVTSTKISVVEKKRIAHIDFATMQRKNIGVRFSLRDEIPIHEGQPSYPTAYPATFKHKRMWSVDLKSNPMFRIDLSIVTDNTIVAYRVEAEVKEIESAMMLDIQTLTRQCNDVVDELLRVISDSQPDPISLLVIPISQITPLNLNLDLRKRKRVKNSSNSSLLSSTNTGIGTGKLFTLPSPSTASSSVAVAAMAMATATTTTAASPSSSVAFTTTTTLPTPVVNDIGGPSGSGLAAGSANGDDRFLQSSRNPVNLYTPTPVTPSENAQPPTTAIGGVGTTVITTAKLEPISLSTILASPSPLLIDAQTATNTLTNGSQSTTVTSGITKSAAVDSILSVAALEEWCQVKAYDWLLVSHSPGTFVLDDDNYEWT